MLRKLEIYFLDVIKGVKHGPLAGFLRFLLSLLSWPYRLIVYTRNWLYDIGWFKQYTPPVPIVVSIGNIVAGGSGKTPATIMLAKPFYFHYKIGILSRGYRSPAEKRKAPLTLCAGNGPQHSAPYCGDEPFLLAENLPKSFVYVGRDRVRSSILASKAGVELLFLDDGAQHRRIARDFEVIVMDVDDPFGHGHYLPRGLLRESPKALGRADFIVVNNVFDLEKFEVAKAQIARYSEAPIIAVCPVVEGVFSLDGSIIDSIQDQKVVAFCGIAQPTRFHNTLKELGAQVLDHDDFPDHNLLSEDQVQKIAKKGKKIGAEALICTEKDKCKLPQLHGLPIPIYWVKIQMQIVQGEIEWKNFISKVENKLIKRA